MKSAAVFLALAAGTTAFSGSQPSTRSMALRAVMDKYAGSIDFRGKEFKFDPVSCR